MDCQHLLFLLCVFLIASSAHGGELPASIRSQYTNCYELIYFSSDEWSISSSHGSFQIDNVCMDLDRSTYYFLSSAQGGTTSFVTAPISRITVVLMSRDTLGIKLRLPSQRVAGLFCHFHEQTHVLDVYNSIYQDRKLTRQNFKVSRIQQFFLDPEINDRIGCRYELSKQAVVYTESYSDTQITLTFKEESVNGDVGKPVLIILAHRCNISDVLETNSVVLHYTRAPLLYFVLTFRNDLEANHFHNSLRGHFCPNPLVSIPSGLQEVLDLVMSIFQE